MISYIEFLHAVRDTIHDYLPDDCRNLDIDVMRADKYMSSSYDGLSVRKKGEDVGVCLDLRFVYETMDNIGELPSALSVVSDVVMDSLGEIPINLEDISMDTGYFLDHVVIQLVNRSTCEKILHEIPHRSMDDMVLVYRIVIPQPDGHLLGTIVDHQMMEKHFLDEEELYGAAAANAQLMWPMEVYDFEHNEGLVFMASGCSDFIGAACMFYPDFIKQMRRRVKGNFYILPFSVSSILVIKDFGDVPRDLLRDVAFRLAVLNERPEEKLTKTIYYCNIEENVITRAGEYVN